MSTAGIDIVQVNIYGVTLADIIEKGVNIPFILGTYGLEKCVAFDVPHMTNTYEQNSQDISTFCSDESFDSVSSDESDPAFTSTHVKQEEEELSVNHSTVAPALPSLFNCSFSTIYSDHVNDINDEEIAPPIEDDNVRERDTNILKNPTNAAETLVDEATIFASHLISESVMDVVLDLLESVENNCSNPPIAQEILDFDEAIHNAEISTLTVENVDEAVPAPYESTQFTAKDAFEETTLPFESGNPNSNQHNLFMPLSSALRAAMNSLDDQLNDNVFGSCLKSNQFVDTHVPTNITTGDNQLLNMSAPRYHLVELDKSETNLNRVEVGNISEHPLDSRPVFDVSQDDFPSSPQNKRICLQNQITPLTNCTRDWITENGVGRVDVVDNVNVFDHDDDDGIDVYENDEVITREQSVPLPTADPLEGVRLTMNNRRKRMTTGSNGELRLLVGKLQKAVTEETRIIKCAYKECTTQMLLRNGYGRDRLVNHVRTHMKGVTPWKCRICEYASTTEGNIRTHHKLKHSETPWNSALKNESPDDLKALLETFRICFPGWDAKFAIDEHNFPDGSHQFKYLGIDDIIKFQRKGRL